VSNDELPEIQVEEVLDEQDELEIDIDLDGDGLPGERPLAAATPPVPPLAIGVEPGAAIPPAPPAASAVADLDLDISIDGGDMELAPLAEAPANVPSVGSESPLPPTALTPPTAGAPLPPTAAPLPPMAAEQHLPPAAAPEVAPETGPAGAPPEIALEIPPDSPTDTPEIALDAGLPPTAPSDDAAEPADDTPVLPDAFNNNEPAAETPPHPAVKPPSSASLDLDALLSDIDLESATKPRTRPSGAPTPPPKKPEPEPETELDGDLQISVEPAALDTDEDDWGIEEEPVVKMSPPADAGKDLETLATLDDVTAEIGAAFDLSEPEPEPEPEPVPEDEPEPEPEPEPVVAEPGAEPSTDGPIEEELAAEAPPLPLSDEEPPAISTISPEALQPDPETLETLKRLAGPAADPEAARAALFAALKGEPYNDRAIPDARALALGAARVLVATGFSINEIVDAIIDAMTE